MSEYSESSPPSSTIPPRVRLVKGQEVSLGCGTLVLIALIVMFFSGRGHSDREQEIRALRNQLEELSNAVKEQTAEIRRLRERLPMPPNEGLEKGKEEKK